MNSLLQKRTHFPRTTASQRQLLFQLWEETGSVQLACRKARVSERTFYNWKPKFLAGGYEAVSLFASHAPKNPSRVKPEIEQKVIELRQQHPNWGKGRIADELAKSNNWVPLVSPNTVRRILQEAGLWTQVEIAAKKKEQTRARTADKPGQTLNVDLCFVPVTHEVAEVVVKLPAVSGSSGRLVVERTLDKAAKSEPQWPGRIFEDQNLTYEEAMAGFASGETKSEPKNFESPEAAAAAALVAQKRAIRQEEEALRAKRRLVRTERKMEDQAWVAIRKRRTVQRAAEKAAQKAAGAQKAAEKTAKKADGAQKAALCAAEKINSPHSVVPHTKALNSPATSLPGETTITHGALPMAETDVLLNASPPVQQAIPHPTIWREPLEISHLVEKATTAQGTGHLSHLTAKASTSDIKPSPLVPQVTADGLEPSPLVPQATTGKLETSPLIPQATTGKLETRPLVPIATTGKLETSPLVPIATTCELETRSLVPQATTGELETSPLGSQATISKLETHHLGSKAPIPDIETYHLGSKAPIPDIETYHLQPQKATSDIETHHLRPKAATSDIETHYLGSKATTPDIKTHHLRPKAVTPDIETHHLGSKATTPDIETHHLDAKATTPDIGTYHLDAKATTPDIETHHLRPKTTTDDVETVQKNTISDLETHHLHLKNTTSDLDTDDLLPKPMTSDIETVDVFPEAITCDADTSYLDIETQVESEPISDSEWRQLRMQRRAKKEQRKEEDIKWREKRKSIRERLSALPLVTAWIAILVIVDNCTRQCIGLPLFMVGPHVTAEMIVEALQTLLPPELQFLISDRGTHASAKVFEMFSQNVGFQHVFTARHRPQSNGIAERFVRTLKEWLADKSWNSEEELLLLLAEFQEEYNERPHQGIGIPGLSPNEYARRIWLM